MYALITVAVQINWTVSRLSVTEGDVVKLSGEVFGSYARPIEIGVVCEETGAVGVEKGTNITRYTAVYMLLARVTGLCTVF